MSTPTLPPDSSLVEIGKRFIAIKKKQADVISIGK